MENYTAQLVPPKFKVRVGVWHRKRLTLLFMIVLCLQKLSNIFGDQSDAGSLNVKASRPTFTLVVR
jgi:hypothetical protein